MPLLQFASIDLNIFPQVIFYLDTLTGGSTWISPLKYSRYSQNYLTYHSRPFILCTLLTFSPISILFLHPPAFWTTCSSPKSQTTCPWASVPGILLFLPGYLLLSSSSSHLQDQKSLPLPPYYWLSAFPVCTHVFLILFKKYFLFTFQ